MSGPLFNMFALIIITALVNFETAISATSSHDDISAHIRKCCLGGLRHARLRNNCYSYDYEAAATIPPLWRGLCLSTHSLCCSREAEKQHCTEGRLAALTGSRCSERYDTAGYADCCRACQVGLAVRASDKNCSDVLFSYFTNFESYSICCAGSSNATHHSGLPEVDDAGQQQEKKRESEFNGSVDIEKPILVANNDKNIFMELNNANNTILPPADDADICGQWPNLCDQICENTREAYRCKCKPGYELDGNGVTCSVDPAATFDTSAEIFKSDNSAATDVSTRLGRDNAQPEHHTRIAKLARSFEKCGEGFQLKHQRCVDIDECVADEHACDSSQVCTNDIGGYHCDCKIGYSLDETTKACVDINECSINNHNCLPTQRCDNTMGSYVCTRLQSCGTGYTLNAETSNCDDDDECTLNTHNCMPAYECHNTKGSFRCYRRRRRPSPSTTATTTTTTTAYPAYAAHQAHGHTQLSDYTELLPLCNTGFQRNHLGACVDVNECLLKNRCPPHQRCINSNGSYHCQNLPQCAVGFRPTPDGTTCLDIDECETGEHNCADNQICHNRNGDYSCSCPPGHQLARLANGLNRCVDINECEQDSPLVCPSNAQCLNTVGSYYCECKTGFRKSRDDERLCLDVDECQDIPGLCQQHCVNHWGGYRCTCNAGYALSADNRTCNDVDECELQKSNRLCMGDCVNVPGSYECSCPRGYTLAMDRNSCRDIDECASGEFCTGRHDVCTNLHGSFKCTTIQCPHGYVNDPDQRNRCRQANNLCENDDCYNKPSAYTYNFITLVSMLTIPPEGRVIFSLRGPLWYDDIDFNLKMVKVQAAANTEKATDSYFDTIEGKHEVNLSLKRSLEGPQEIELELSMTVFTNGMPRGKSVAKIFILVSQYTF